MNFQQVTQFLTIVKHMNLSKAASELYISQPALSQSLARLEHELNVQLFYRDKQKLILSPAGKRLFDDFKELKKAQDKLSDDAADFFLNEKDSIVTIGFTMTPLFFYTLYMSGLFDQFQSISMEKIFANADQILSMLKNGMIDFAITCPPLFDDRITTQTILLERFVLAVSSGHPLADQSSISITELPNIPLTGMKKHQPTQQYVDWICTQNHISLQYVHEYDYLEYYSAIRNFAYTDQFANLVPDDFFESTYGDGYVCIPVTGGNLVRQTCISWLTESQVHLEKRELLEHLIRSVVSQQTYHTRFSGIFSKLF